MAFSLDAIAITECIGTDPLQLVAGGLFPWHVLVWRAWTGGEEPHGHHGFAGKEKKEGSVFCIAACC